MKPPVQLICVNKIFFKKLQKKREVGNRMRSRSKKSKKEEKV
jgi:hypothetical protein